MRISDWSSDVCSSDLRAPILRAYTDDLHVAVVAAALLQILPWFHLCDAMQCIGSYLLRAYKIAVVPLILQIVALTGLGLIGGWWLGFGPAAGALAPVIAVIAPGAPVGAGTMWLMAWSGLTLSRSARRRLGKEWVSTGKF